MSRCPCHAEEVLQLVQGEQDRGAYREADDDAVRDVARQVAEAQQRDAGLDGADEQADHDGGPHALGRREDGKGAEQGDGDGVGRTVDELLR